jgi:hypothetical protein
MKHASSIEKSSFILYIYIYIVEKMRVEGEGHAWPVVWSMPAKMEDS